jgi:hypothetical protein
LRWSLSTFSPWLASSRDPPYLYLLSSWNYRLSYHTYFFFFVFGVELDFSLLPQNIIVIATDEGQDTLPQKMTSWYIENFKLKKI